MTASASIGDDQVFAIARRQKLLILLIVVQLALVWIPLASVVLAVVAAIFVFRLAQAVGATAWLYAVALFIPLVGLVAMLVLNARATARLRERGIRVGLIGARRADLEKLRQGQDVAAAF